MRIAYVVSRFPDPSETFVLRELNRVDGRDGLDVELFVLFPPKDPFVHPDARRWMARAHRSSPLRAASGLAWWLARRPGTLLTSLGAVVRGYGRRPSRLLRALVTFAVAAGHARTMAAEDVRHVHAHFATYPALTAWLASRLTGVGYSFTAHAHDIFVDQSHLRRLVDDAAFVAVISDFNRQFLGRFDGASRTPVHVVHCGVDPDAYAFRVRPLPASGPIRAICVASLNELKGHRVLLDALASGRPGLERVHLDLVGSGPLEDELRRQADRLGIAERVHFLGTRTEDDVARLLDAAHVFVLASVPTPSGRMDGIPVAIIEALASGIPVVATRLSGIPELVRDGVTGVLATPGEPAALAAALERLLADPAAVAERAHAGRMLVEEEFAIERSAGRMAELLRSVATR